MCGIAGYFGPKDIPDGNVQHCLDLMRRRGPDHAAFRRWSAPGGRNMLLLHTRLSIIDLDERSHQPLRVGTKWIALNGELYNYLERRKELEALGRSFSTSSDTEVLLTGIDQQDAAFLEGCEGMWAFAVYDETDGTLMLSRDRFGEKPLYIYRENDDLFFASEVKFITALLGHRLDINRDHILRYMVNGYKSLYKDGHTFYNGLSELPSATFMKIDARGNESRERYWTPVAEPDETMTRDDAVAGARERLIRSVELRLRADVPLAFCMSGGVDSNALIAIAKTVFDYDVHGFTVTTTDERYEEQDMVDCAVKSLGLRHTSIPVRTESFLPRLRVLVNYHDAPVYTITYFAHWMLMESIVDHGYRISVSGTAADELFSGYFDHHLTYLYAVRNDADLYQASREAWEKHIRPVVRNPLLQDPDAFIKDPELRDHIFFKANGFSKRLKAPWSEPFTESRYTDELMRNRMLNELFHEAIPVILHEDDLNAMYFSIENRSPFLDRELFEFCYRIPTRYLIRDGLGKAVLRDAMRDIVPEPILQNRRKVGFNAPVFSFLDVGDPEVRASLLDHSPIFEMVRRETIEELLAKPTLPNSESKFLFYFISAKMFLEESAS